MNNISEAELILSCVGVLVVFLSLAVLAPGVLCGILALLVVALITEVVKQRRRP